MNICHQPFFFFLESLEIRMGDGAVYTRTVRLYNQRSGSHGAVRDLNPLDNSDR